MLYLTFSLCNNDTNYVYNFIVYFIKQYIFNLELIKGIKNNMLDNYSQHHIINITNCLF